MDTTAQTVIGCDCLGLAQKRFANGSLYVCAICTDGELSAVDVRYFGKDGMQLHPSRQGFRVPIKHVAAFIAALQSDPSALDDAILWETESKKLVARYCDDQYGVAVDFRYFRTTAKYTGWEKRGIRLHLDDYLRLRELLLSSPLLTEFRVPTNNLLVGFEIVPFRSEVKVASHHPRSAPTGSSRAVGVSSVNPALQSFLNEL